MKKILFLILALSVPLYAAKDTIKSGGLWDALTWSLGAPPSTGDTVYKTNIGTYHDTMNANYTVVAFIIDPSTPGTHWRNGRNLTVTGSGTAYSDDGTGTRDMGTGLTISGASATVHIGSTVGATAAANCAVAFNSTGIVLDDDKGIKFKSITLGASASATSSGTGTTEMQPGTNLTNLRVGNGATFTVSAPLQFNPAGTCSLWVVGTGCTINGTGQWYINQGTANVVLPALTYSGSGAFDFPAAANGTFIVVGAIAWPGTWSIRSTATTTYTGGNYTHSFGAFRVGSAGASGVFTFNAGAGVYTVTSFVGSTYNTGTSNDNLQTSQWSCSGNWTFGTNHTVDPGTSLATFTGASTITTNGKPFYDITFNNASTGTAKTADSIYIKGDLTLTDGRDSMAAAVKIDGDYVNNNTDSVFHTGNIYIGGNLTRAAAANKVKRTGGAMYFDIATAHTFTGGGNSFGPINFKTISVADNKNRWQKATMTDGGKLTLHAADTITIDTIGDLTGSAGSLDSIVSSSAGTRAIMIKGRRDTASYRFVKDIFFDSIMVLDSNSRTGGNNRNVKSLSYYTVTKAIDSGIKNDTVTLSGYGFIGGGASVGGKVVTLTVTNYKSAYFIIPDTTGAALAVKAWNSDLDTVSIGNIEVTAQSGRRRNFYFSGFSSWSF